MVSDVFDSCDAATAILLVVCSTSTESLFPEQLAICPDIDLMGWYEIH